MLIVLLLLPVAIAERYTSPTQDGEFILRPQRAWGLIFTLIRVDDSAVLGSSGDALREAMEVYRDSPDRPIKVELLYLSSDEAYAYITKEGERFVIATPPRLVWEVWGRGRTDAGLQGEVDVIGFLDYESGRPIGLADSIARAVLYDARRTP